MPAPKLLTSLPDASNFRIGARFEPDAILVAASVEHPDAGAVAIDRDPGRGSDLPALGKLEEAVDELIGRPLRPRVVGERKHHDADDSEQSRSGARRSSSVASIRLWCRSRIAQLLPVGAVCPLILRRQVDLAMGIRTTPA